MFKIVAVATLADYAKNWDEVFMHHNDPILPFPHF